MEASNQPSLGKRILKVLGFLALSFLLMQLGGITEIFFGDAMEACEDKVLVFFLQYASFIGIWIAFIAFALLNKKQKPLLKKLGRQESGNRVLFALGAGLVLGLGLNLAVGGVAMLQKNITLTYAGFNPGLFFAFMVAVFIQSSAEELVTRWFIYENVKKLFPSKAIVPILVNACFFMALHLFNNGISPLPLVSLVLVGILYSLLVYYFNSIWAAMVAHASWNFCQNILLGLPNSGIVSAFSVFRMDAANATNGFAYDTAFGIEGSPMAAILLAVAIVALILIGRKKQQKAA